MLGSLAVAYLIRRSIARSPPVANAGRLKASANEAGGKIKMPS
jgi:hypothetical protein